MKEKNSKAKKISLIVVLVILTLLLYSILSSRFTPSTNQVRVQGLSTSLAPMVSGYVADVRVSLHAKVKQGDTLFILDQTPYLIALNQAEISLENATQNVSASVAGLKAATAQLNRAKVAFDRANKNWQRTKNILAQNVGALSAADKDRSESSFLSAKEGVSTAQANLERQKAALGPTNNENPMIKSALNQLEKANWDLAQTVITAPSDGVIESFNIETGYFASAGRPLVTLVSNKTIWIQANLSEKNLTHLKVNNSADITFDVDAGEVYKAKVASIAYGVKTQTTSAGDLPTVRGKQGWLREQQRFPVIITLENTEVYQKLRQGSQGVVVVYTKDRPLLNLIAEFKIWFSSKMSYVR